MVAKAERSRNNIRPTNKILIRIKQALLHFTEVWTIAASVVMT